MRSAQKLEHLRDAYLFQGKVYARLDETKSSSDFRLRIGKTEVPFVDSEPGAFDPLRFDQDILFDLQHIDKLAVSEPAQSKSGEHYTVWVNELKEWTLSGTQTLQITFAKRDKPLGVRFQNAIEIKDLQSEMEFRAEIAVHRADAELRVMIEDIASGETTEEVIQFQPQYGGGNLEPGYQNVRVKLPDSREGLRLSFGVTYNEYISDTSNHGPFLFIARPRVVSADRPVLNMRPVHLIENVRQGPSRWAEAPLPCLMGAGQILQVVHGSQAVDLYLADEPKIELRENHGHTFILNIDTSLEALLFIDGELVTRLSLGPASVIRIPAKYLNGCQRHVCVKDKSASRILWETVTILPYILTPADVIQRESAAPFPSTLFPQSAHRYGALKAHLRNAGGGVGPDGLAEALATVEGGYDNVKLKLLHFPEVEEPDVSIVIPAHNKVEVTYLALCSLLLAYNEASFEVIVVDDASTDETAELENYVSGITVIHNEIAQRFIRACNAGAEKARGKYIVLLNNDVEVTAHWLDELIAAFDRFGNVGLVGSKLLYPDGTLQDAGGIIWGSGNPWNYGKGQNPDDPRFTYARQADYLSGAAMMVPATLWHEVGGLSSYLEPMYFEDTDLAFKIREAGYTTWYVPSSIVYHYEGMTSGTDTSSGFKKFQEVNRPKFKRRWAKAYTGHGRDGVTPDLEKDRGIVGRVLFIDAMAPRPDRDAGSYAAIQEMRLVQSLGYKVSFLPTNMAHLGRYTHALQKMGVEALHAPFHLSPSEYLEQHAAEFDAVYITRYYVAQEVLDVIRKHAPMAKILFNNADLHFLREIRAAKVADSAPLMEQARATRDLELGIIRKVDVALSYTEVEHSVIQAYTEGGTPIVKCPWVVETVEEVAPLSGRRGMSFLGNYLHHPNAEGVLWFVREIMPAITAATGGLPFWIYGSGMTDEVRALKSPLVHPEGFVENARDAYDKHRIFVAPLLSGAGIKGKVLSALACGTPCILTPTAAEGIGLRHKHDCFIADTAEDWVAAVKALTEDDDLWQRISDNALSYMRDAYSFEIGRKRMREAFEAVDMFQSLD